MKVILKVLGVSSKRYDCMLKDEKVILRKRLSDPKVEVGSYITCEVFPKKKGPKPKKIPVYTSMGDIESIAISEISAEEVGMSISDFELEVLKDKVQRLEMKLSEILGKMAKRKMAENADERDDRWIYPINHGPEIGTEATVDGRKVIFNGHGKSFVINKRHVRRFGDELENHVGKLGAYFYFVEKEA